MALKVSGPVGLRDSEGQPEHVATIVPLMPIVVESPSKTAPDTSSYVPLLVLLSVPVNGTGIGKGREVPGNWTEDENVPDPIFGVKVQLPKLRLSVLPEVTVAAALLQDSVNPPCEKSVSVNVKPLNVIEDGLYPTPTGLMAVCVSNEFPCRLRGSSTMTPVRFAV